MNVRRRPKSTHDEGAIVEADRKGPVIEDHSTEKLGRFSGKGTSNSVFAIVRRIDALIERGALVPGQRLVEADLVEELGAGRVPVREALRILAGDGVVELFPNRGARIRRFDPQRLLEMLEAVTGLSLMVVRRLCYQKLDKQAEKDLLEALSRIKAAAVFGSSLEMMKSLINWHDIAEHYAKNEYISDMTRRIHLQHYIYQVAETVPASTISDVAHSYNRLTAAVLKSDWSEADPIMQYCWMALATGMQGSAPDPLARKARTKAPLSKPSPQNQNANESASNRPRPRHRTIS